MNSSVPPIIDPVTGLPLDDFSGVIQQIPLGSQVFPFEDLNADGRMTRQPIYGDDILPTSALVVGQDTAGVARAGMMDSARRLWTREAVFQNKGQPIPDGTTAPVDVNVVSGGGSSSGPIAPNGWSGPSNQIEYSAPADDSMVFNCPTDALLYNIHATAVLDPLVVGSPIADGYGLFFLYMQQNGVPVPNFPVGGEMLYYSSAQPEYNVMRATIDVTFPIGLRLTDVGFPSGSAAYLYYHVGIAPIRLSGYMSWKV